MSEVLRDLVVSLSLDSNNFSRNLTSINRQVAEAESAFKRAAAGVDGFEKSVAGTQAQLSSLQQKLVAQRNAVSQYERALEAANTKLVTSVRKNGELKTSLDAAKTRYSDLKTRIDQTKAAFQASVKATGDNSEESNRLGLELLDLEDQYKATGAEVKKLDGQLAASTKSLQNNADAVTKTRTGLNQAHAALKQTESQIRSANARLATLESAWTKSGNALAAFSKKASAVSKNLTSTGTAMTRYGTMPILALGAAAVKSSISYESAFASVRKTVDATEQEYAELSASIKQMSTEVATGADSIAEVTAVAGQLGIQNQYLVDFTRTMIDLGNSTDIAASEGAVSLAQFANVTGMSQSRFSNFGATLVDLGNSFATTESAILNMATRLASAGSQVGMTQPQILGFATALSSVGLEAEAGGTAFSKAMIEMQLAVETGSESLSDFSRVAGMTSQQFTALWKSDPSAAIQAFIVGLSGMSEEGISAIGVLEEMGFSEVRLRDTLLRATNASELFTQAQQTALTAWEENTALSAEASKRYATTESKLKNLKNTAVLFARQLGDDLNPTIQNLIDGAGDLIERFQALDESQRMQIIRFAAIAAAAGPTLMIFGKASKAISSITGTIGKFMIAVGKAGGGVKGLLTVVGSSPSVWLALGAATVVATVALIDYATGAKAAREAIRGMNEQAEEWQNTQAQTIYDTGNDAFARFGLDTADFTGTLDESKDWISRLTETWTDGKAETTEIVKSYVDEFVAGSDAIREAIKNRKKIQAGLGANDPQNDEYLAQLDAYDKEVERLLKKRQNGFLSEDDQKRLDEVIELRAQIQFEYATGEGSGYDGIRQGVEAEKARLEAEADGQPVAIGVDLYTDALTAGAQGYQAQVDAFNASYRDQYAAVQAISDKEERDAALKVLNTRHQEALNKAQAEYNTLVSDYAPEVFQSEDTQQAYKDLEKFKELIAEVQSDGVVSNDEITRMQTFTDTLDEGRLASFLALIAQANEAGLGDLELGTEYGGIRASDLLGGYDTITDFLSAHKGDGFDSLSAIFGAAEDEAMRVLVDLGLSSDGQTLKDWLDAERLVMIANVSVKEGLTVSDIPATGYMYRVTLGEGVSVSDVLASGKVTSAYVADDVMALGTADANGQMVFVSLADGATVEDVTATGLITTASPVGSLQATIPGTVTITGYTVSEDVTPLNMTLTPLYDLSLIDQTAIDAYYTANPDKKPAVEMEVGLKSGWTNLLLAAYNGGSLSVFGADGARLNVTPELLSTISPTDIIRYETDESGAIRTDEKGRPIIDVIIVPKLGSKETAEAASEAANSTPDNMFSWLGMTDSAKKDASEVASTLTEIERLRAKIAELKETGQASDEEGIPLSDYQSMLTATEESLYTMLADLDEMDLSKIAKDMAAIIAAMQAGEVDTTEGMTLLDPYLREVRRGFDSLNHITQKPSPRR